MYVVRRSLNGKGTRVGQLEMVHSGENLLGVAYRVELNVYDNLFLAAAATLPCFSLGLPFLSFAIYCRSINSELDSHLCAIDSSLLSKELINIPSSYRHRLKQQSVVNAIVKEIYYLLDAQIEKVDQ